MYITTNQPDTESNPNPNTDPTTKQHAVVSIQLNILTCPMYPEKFIQDNVIAPFSILSVVVVVTLPRILHFKECMAVQSSNVEALGTGYMEVEGKARRNISTIKRKVHEREN